MRPSLKFVIPGLVAATVAVPALQVVSQSPATAVTSGSIGAAAAASWQSNATVWKMAYANGDIWMVGDFTSLRPPGAALGTSEHPANYFAALHASTGALDGNVNDTHTFTNASNTPIPLTNGAVAASPDGKTIYVGGKFTEVDGQPRNHIAAFSATDGHLLSWAPSVGAKVAAIATYGNVVYIGGAFGKVGSTTVGAHLAALNATTGAVVKWGPGNGPATDDLVDALAVSSNGSQVVAGGYFNKVNGLAESVDHQTKYQKAVILGGVGTSVAGRPEAMPANAKVPLRPVGVQGHICNSHVKDIVISGTAAYFANEGTGGGCFDGTWALVLQGGALKWINQCQGATQTIAVIRGYLYKGSHAHDCQSDNRNGDPDNFPQLPGNQSRHLLSERVSNGFLGPWYPFSNAGPNLGPRAMATDGTQLYVGGDFTFINHRPQQGIARFTPGSDSPTPQPHRPTVAASKLGQMVVTVAPPLDLDNPDLTMELFRNGGSTPVARARVHSVFWRQPKVHLVDKTAVPGTKVTYRVRAVATFGTGASPLSPVSLPRTVLCAPGSHIHAAVTAVSVHKLRHHKKVVRISVCNASTVRISAKVVRKHHRLAHASKLVQRGHHGLALRIGRHAHGRARLTVTFRVGKARQVTHRTIRLPR